MADARSGRPVTRVAVTVGLERLLWLASADPALRAGLLRDRPAALAAAGLALSEGEAAVLAAVDRDLLAAMIDAVQPATRPPRPFLKAVAATCLALATATAELACEPTATKGIQPDWDPGPDRDAAAQVDAAAPDVPLDPDDSPTRGITADVP